MKKKKNIKKYIYITLIGLLIIILSFYFLRNNNNVIGKLKTLSSVSFINNDNYIKSNELLESEINELKVQVEELKKVTEIKKIMVDKRIINASIIKRSDRYWFNIITINKGKNDGIKKGNPVISTTGLVGEVVIVNNNSSEIKLITSNNKNYISAKFMVDDKEYFGIIKEYNTIKNELYLENVIGDISNYKDALVVTSGLSNNYPSGLLIGKIVDMKKDKFNLSNTFVIKPSADYNDINIVMVVSND